MRNDGDTGDAAKKEECQEFVESQFAKANLQPTSGVIKKNGEVVARIGDAKNNKDNVRREAAGIAYTPFGKYTLTAICVAAAIWIGFVIAVFTKSSVLIEMLTEFGPIPIAKAVALGPIALILLAQLVDILKANGADG